MRSLSRCMIVGGYVPQIRLELRDDFGMVGACVRTPVGGAESIVVDEVPLTLEDELTEASLGVGPDGPGREIRRRIGLRIAVDIGQVCLGRVLVTLLGDIEIAQPRVEQRV